MTQPNRSTLRFALLAPLLLLAGACAPADDAPEGDDDTRTGDAVADTGAAARADGQPPLPEAQEAFWSNLTDLCDEAYEGEIAASEPEGTDDDFAGQEMVMHVRECEDDVIRIPFHVGDDRSRTWVITRTADGLRLKHDHRHEDGSPDEVTMYGGDTADEGSSTEQQFPADAETAEMLPAAATNVWTVGVEPGQTFTYALRREGTDRLFRVAFDLTESVEAPPTPWGWD